jgi:glycine amidinotransferase
VTPRSRLLDNNFDYSYVRKRGFDGEIPETSSYEIMFDGAQVARIGRDLIFNASTANHRMGVQWLTRHLGDRYNIHVVEITDNHIDAMLLPLRPGTLLVRDIVDRDQIPEPFRTWEIIWYEWLERPIEVEQEGVPLLASQSVGMNVLSLDENHVVVQDIQVPLMRNLEKAGLTPIPCRWRHGRSLGGGFHCVTLDTVRAGEWMSYI